MKFGKKILAGILAITCILTSGCSLPGRRGSSQLTVDESGVLTERIEETGFDEDYTEDELKKYIGKSIRAYDASKDAAVRLESCKIDGSTVKIEMTYRTVQDYSNYNKVPCFLGTIAQARAAGFDVEQEYLDADGNKGDLGQILKRAKEWKIFIVSEPVGVRVSDKIIYATDNVSVTGRMTAEVQTVREDSGQENTSSADRKEPQEGSQDSSGKNGESETIDRLTTVADRYAYIIFK